MQTRIADRNVWLIYAAIFLLGLAYGISISLVAVFLKSRGFTEQDIGTLAAWFALGIVALSLPMGALIRRFSARRTLILSLFGYAAAVTAFPFLSRYESVAAVRFFDGAFSVGVWVSCETILLSRAGKENKAYVTSLYAVAMACGYIVGPLLAWVVVQFSPMRTAFVISGVIAAAAAALVALRLAPDVRHDDALATSMPEAPSPALHVHLSSLALLGRIKTSCFATFAYGYFQASLVLFLPLYLIASKGVLERQTILITACFATGMLLFSNVAGRLGDRYGHLLVMRVLATIGTVMVLGFVFLDSFAIMCGAVFVAGATLATISPVSLALQGVTTEPRNYSRANAIYNVFYAAGMLLGPLISSTIYRHYGSGGGAAMLYHLAALWAVFVVFTVVFAGDDPAARRGRVPLPVVARVP